MPEARPLFNSANFFKCSLNLASFFAGLKSSNLSSSKVIFFGIKVCSIFYSSIIFIELTKLYGDLDFL